MRYMQYFIIALLLVGFGIVQAEEVDWQAFSKNLVVAIQSSNEGLRESALRQVIRYEGKLDVNAAIFDIVGIYRNHNDLHVRQLALVALYKTQNPWAMDFLRRHLQFETNKCVHKMTLNVVADYYAANRISQPDTAEVMLTAK